MVFHESLDHHEHGGHHHSHAGHDHQSEDENGDESPAEHGDGSVAHRNLAAQIPLPSVPVLQEALLVWSALPTRAHQDRPVDRQPRTINARGPPAQTA